MESYAKSDKQPRRIALVDGNNFYASCERVFRPAWRNRPIGVLSNNDGCIIARSDEVKEAGIPMGAPYFKYKDQLNAINAILVSSNYCLYGDMSARMFDTLQSFTPDMEIYSIDEAWLNLTGFKTETLDSYARQIVDTTYRHTGIPVSMGIAPTKVLAKLANRICKKRKIPGNVFNMGSAEHIESLLASTDVGDVWGIGRRWADNLKSIGIYTALDLRNAEPDIIRQKYNVVMQRIVLELRGISCLHREDIEPKKQIIASRSFGEKVTDKTLLYEAVSHHASRAAEKLRLQGSVCGCIQISIRSSPFSQNEPFYSRSTYIAFPVATADTALLIRAARSAVDALFKSGIRYAKAGVMLYDIKPAHSVQPTLFHHGDSNKRIALMQAMDNINQQCGSRTIYFASCGTKQIWQMKRENRTPCYTTSWDDLPCVQ